MTDSMLDQVDPGGAQRYGTSPLKLAILAIVGDHRGRMRSIDRRSLGIEVLREVGYVISDREIREAIQELRAEDPRGALIMSSAGASGYWIARDLEEIQDSYQEERSRALSILVRIRAQRRLARLALESDKPVQASLPQLGLFG